jgi:hypothetical protein
MTTASHTKHYRDPARATAARTHLDWLRSLGSGVRLPALLEQHPGRLRFEHLGEHHPGPHDLPLVADALGQLHAAAHRHLPGARLDRPYTVSNTLTIPAFTTARRHVLSAPLPALLPVLPAAIYKDANLRNTLLTDTGVALVDFDDLTLAPFGYDLAKLIVSTAMTYGPLPDGVIGMALAAYNRAADVVPVPACPPPLLRLYTDVHHTLTARYLGRNGYRHDWAQVAPWPAAAPAPQP